jgi:hypothetical protein
VSEKLGATDVSNSNTPAIVDPPNSVGGTAFRVVAQVDKKGKLNFPKTNAYSGNNGGAATLNNTNDNNKRVSRAKNETSICSLAAAVADLCALSEHSSKELWQP